MAFESSSSTLLKSLKLALLERQLLVLEQTSSTEVIALEVQNKEWVLRMADGGTLVLPLPDSLNALQELLAQLPLDLARQLSALASSPTMTVAQLGGLPAAVPNPPEANTNVIAQVVDSAGDVKVQRAGAEIALAPGNVLLVGDTVLTAPNAQLRIELLSQANTVTGTGVMGENVKVTLGQRSTDLGSAAVFRVDVGALVFDKLIDSGVRLQVITNSGAVQTGGQGFGINVNSQTGETTVISLQGAGQTTGDQSSVQITPLGAALTPIMVPAQGVVLNPSSGGASGGPTTAGSAASVVSADNQVAPISKLIMGPGAADASPLGGGQVPAAGTNLAPTGSLFSPTSASLSSESAFTNGRGPISGSNLAAPISVGLQAMDQRPAPSDVGGQPSTINPPDENGRAVIESKITMPVVPRISIFSSAPVIDENLGSVFLTVKLNEPTTQLVTVRWVVDGTHTLGSMSALRVPSTTGLLQFRPGETSQQLEVIVSPDFQRQPEGSFTVTLASAVGGIVGSPSTQTIAIIDEAAMLGSDQADNMAGGDSADTLLAGLGDDTLLGGNGADSLDGGAGNDSLDGGTGDDTLDGGAGNDNLWGGAGADTLRGGTGNDTLEGGAGVDTLDGGVGDDGIVFDANDVLVDGGAGNDRLILKEAVTDLTSFSLQNFINFEAIDLTGNGHNTLKLSNSNITRLAGGNNTLHVLGDGVDKLILLDLDWALGNDVTEDGITYKVFTLHGQTLRVDADVQVVFEVNGTLTSEVINGGSNADVIDAKDGDDTLDGGLGADRLLGGGGDDTLIFDPQDVAIDGGEGTDTLVVREAQLDLSSLTSPVLTGIEKIVLDASRSTALTLDDTSARNLSDTSNTLYITGEGTDSLTLVGIWTEGASTPIGGVTYITYTSGTAPNVVTVYVQDTVPVSLSYEGTDGDDFLQGSAKSDLLDGKSGNDTLMGGGGNDVLRGGPGNDTMDGGAQSDTADYSRDSGFVVVDLGLGRATDGSGGTDTLRNIENVTGSAGNDRITGDDEFNNLEGGAGDDTIDGGAGNDSLSGGSGHDSLIGGTGNDTLTGGAGNDSLIGGAGNDVLSGGTGNDTLSGGEGTDTADYSESGNPVTLNLTTGTAADGTGGRDTLMGIENAKGGAGHDSLTGNADANRLEGGAGNDTLSGGAGDDSLDGGLGDADGVSYANNTADQAVIVNLADGTATDGMGGTDALLNIENVVGGAGSDTITGNSGHNLLEGGAGDDSLDGGAGDDTLQGGDGHDTLKGGTGRDELDGGNGIDLADFSNESQAMTISLIDGFMRFTGSTTDTDTLTDIENVYAGVGNDSVVGDALDNVIWGNLGHDAVNAGGGNDAIRGGAGDDTLDGGSGSDTVLFDDVAGPVVINLGAASVTVGSTLVAAGSSKGLGFSTAGTDTLQSIENVVASGGADTVYGSSDDNTIDGADGADSIDAGAGQDRIYFDEFDAKVDGGSGTDTLVIKSSTSVADLTLARDAVFTNFEVVDLSANGSQLLKISDADVRAMGVGSNTLPPVYNLTVHGSADDNVRLVGPLWPRTPSSSETIGSVSYNIYSFTDGGVTTSIKIQQGVPVGYLIQGADDNDSLQGLGGSDELVGSGGNDSLNGDVGDDLVDGGLGNDRLAGGAGRDTLSGGQGTDALDGGEGNDYLDGGDGNDELIGGAGNDTLLGGTGDDAINGGTGNDVVSGGEGHDTMLAGEGDDTVDGGAGDDVIDAGSGNDIIRAGIGNDTVNGGPGNDTLDGGAGVDLLDYSSDTSGVVVNLMTETATSATSGSDVILNFENVTSGSGNDRITGSDASNRIIGGAGTDTIQAGAGDDWVLFDNEDATVDGGAGNDTLAIQTSPVDFRLISDDRYRGFEALDLTNANGLIGSQSVTMALSDVMAFSDTRDELKIHGDPDDTVTLVGNWTVVGTQPVTYSDGVIRQYVKLQMSDPLTGNPVTVLVDPDVSVKLLITGTESTDSRTSGNDTLVGGAGHDTVLGLSGDDIIDGAAGADRIDAGSGNDTIVFDANDHFIDGGVGSDKLKFASTAHGTILDLTQTSQTIQNIETIDITGKATSPVGNNTLVIGIQNLAALMPEERTLTVDGDAGDTVFLVGGSGVWGTPVLTSGYQVYSVTVGPDTYTLKIKSVIGDGSVVQTTSSGNGGGTAQGTTGDDLIVGLAGNDVMDGGAGSDLMDAGAGDDTLVFDAGDASVEGGQGRDTLQATGAAMDMTAISDTVFKNIEVIDLLTGSPNTTLTMALADVTALNPAKTVSVLGDANDALALHGNWTQGLDIDLNGSTYKVFTLDGATVQVQTAVPVRITYTGTLLSDRLISGAGNQAIEGGAGADFLNGGQGNDTLNGGEGVDKLIYDPADGAIIGGTGSDTLAVSGAGQTLDLTLVGNAVISGMEVIDLTGTGDNVLVLTPDDLQALSEETNTLIVTGNEGDSVRLAGTAWEARGSELVAGITYNKYVGMASDGSPVTLLLGLQIAKGDEILGTEGNDNLMGTSGGDKLLGLAGHDTLNGGVGADRVDGGDGNDVLVYDREDILLDGGAGSDTLSVMASGEIIDLQLAGRQTGGALQPTLLSLESLDLNTTGANYLILDEVSVRSLTAALDPASSTTVAVSGNADDIIFVDGADTLSPLTLSNLTTITLSGGITVKRVIKGDDVASSIDDNINDTTTSTSGVDVIKSGEGQDTINSDGADIIDAGAGNDVVYHDANDLRVFGGIGTDTLVVTAVDANGGVVTTNAGSNSAIGDVDFTATAGTIYTGFEVISMRGHGQQTIKLDEPSVLAMSSTGKITVQGDAGDALKLYGAWTSAGVESDTAGKMYNILQKGTALVSVEQSVTLQVVNELGAVTKIGTDDQDDLNVPTNGGAYAGDGDDILRIYNTAFTGVDGGRGYDKVYFQLSNETQATQIINTLLIASKGLTQIEEIDLTRDQSGLTAGNEPPSLLSKAPNKLILSPEKLLEMTDQDGILVVRGDPTIFNHYNPLTNRYDSWDGISRSKDVIDLVGDWGNMFTNVSTVIYNGETFTQVTALNGAKLLYTPALTTTVVNTTPQLSAFSIAYNDGAYLVGSGIDQYAGWKVENAGDVNKDGIDDMIINARDKAYVVFGTDSLAGQLDLADLGNRGFTVTGVGTGNFSSDNNFLNTSGPTGPSFASQATFQNGLSSIGDVNGDGMADLATNVYGNNSLVRVIYGRTEWSNLDAALLSFAPSASDGYTIQVRGFGLDSSYTDTTENITNATVIKAVGDVNGDGYADFVVSNPYATYDGSVPNSPATTKGVSHLIFGGIYSGNKVMSALPSRDWVSFLSDAANPTHIGADVTGLGDINGDGYDDFLIGGPGFNEPGVNGQTDTSGSGYIVFGKADGWGNSVVVQRDLTAPTAMSFSPADNNNAVALTSNLQVTFSEEVKAGSGLIVLYNTATGRYVESFNAATGLGNMGGKLVIAGTSLTVNPFAPLQTAIDYHVQIQSGAVLDLAGNAYSGVSDSNTLAWNFRSTSSASTDVTAPALSHTFELTATNVSYDPSYSYSSYYIGGGSYSPSGIVSRASGYGDLATTYRFEINFSEAIKPFGMFTLMEGSTVVEVYNLQTGVGSRGGSIQMASNNVDGTKVYVSPFATLKGSALHSFKIDAVQDSAGNEIANGTTTFSFTTAADTTAAILQKTDGSAAMRGSVVDGATGVLTEQSLTFEATEALRFGLTGKIEIRAYAAYDSASAFLSFDLASATQSTSNGVVTLTAADNGSVMVLDGKSLTINPSGVLAYNTHYALYIEAGALTDLNGTPVVRGIYQQSNRDSIVNPTAYTDKETLDFTTIGGFTTAPGGNAVNNSLKVGVNDNIEISFSETVSAGTQTAASKFIKLYDVTGRFIQSFDVTSSAGDMAFSGSKVVLNPTNALNLASGYYLTVDAGAIQATNHSGQFYAGTANPTTLMFSTEAASQVDPGQTPTSISQPTQTSVFSTNGWWGGQAVEAIGDFDGDGVNDFVVGTFQMVADNAVAGGYAYGKFYVVFGKAGEWAPVTTIDQLKAQGRVVEIHGTADNWITRIAEFGDMNKDGYADLLLSSGGKVPNNDASNSDDPTVSNDGDKDSGAVFVVFGQDRGAWTPSVSVSNLGSQGLEITGGLPQEQMGYSIAAGDYNHDGRVDMLMGMPVNHRGGFSSGEGFVINGGDFTSSFMKVGTTLSDLMVGDDTGDRISGAGGNDTIHGLGGADVLRGGEGDDTVSVSDLDFVLIDGGTGSDTFQFKGHNIHLDLTGYAGASLRSFETIDITGDGANSLVFNYREAVYLLERQLTSAYGQYYAITIEGDGDDRLTLEGPWAQVSVANGYTTYGLEGIYVKVKEAIQETVVGWTIPYTGATVSWMPSVDMGTVGGSIRTSAISGDSGFDVNLASYLINIGDVNNDGFADFALKDFDATSSSNFYMARGIEAVYSTVNNVSVFQYYRYPTPTAGAYHLGYNGDVTVIFGKAGGIGTVDLAQLSGAGMRVTGSSSATDQFGYAVANLGDIDGDGKQDMLISAPRSSKTLTFNEGGEQQSLTGWNSDSWGVSSEGRLFFYMGGNATLAAGASVSATTTSVGNNTNGATALPSSTSGADLPQRGSSMSSTVFSYTTSGQTANGSFVGSAANANLGYDWTPVMVGDVNGDGFDDFLTGKDNTKLVFGKATGWTGLDQTAGWTLTQLGSWSHVSSAGDMNGDGYADFVLASANARYLVFGKTGAWNSSVSIPAGNPVVAGDPAVVKITPETGIALNAESNQFSLNSTLTSALGDINGDGYADLLIAASYLADFNAKDNGGAYVVFGAASGWASDYSLANLASSGRGFRITGSVDAVNAGFNMTAAGDVNGDGMNDFILTEANDYEALNDGQGGLGSAYLIFGRPSSWKDINLLEVQDYGVQLLDGGWSTHAWQAMGDIDGDGFADLGYSTSNSAKIMYGTSYLTHGSNVGVQHVETTTGATLTAGLGASVSPNPDAGMDRLIGNAGNDTLLGDGGRDVLLGGAGNDVMKVADGNFFKLDGGTGVDTVLIQQTNPTNPLPIDFTVIMNSRIENIEVLQLGNGTQTVKLNALDVLTMTGEANNAVVNGAFRKGNVLVIDTGAGSGSDTADSVELTGTGWTDTGIDTAVTGLTGSFSVYQNSSQNIYALVDTAATLS